MIEPGASSQTSRVLRLSRAARSAGFMGSYNWKDTPQPASSAWANALFGPYTLSGIKTSSPAFKKAISTSTTAASPLGVSVQCRPPSSVTMRCSSVKVVGVPCRP